MSILKRLLNGRKKQNTSENNNKEFNPKDILIFQKCGTPIVSKNEIFKEGLLAVGLLSTINTFVSNMSDEELTCLTLEKNKIILKHMNDLIGAIVLNINDNECIASELLEKLLAEISLKGLDNAEQVMHD
ncbi:MAG: hypothetical protein ACTSO9_19910, partial [Candidatus Helarchaeota archaeon]